MSYLKRLLLLFFVMAACVGCDQTTKVYAERHLPDSRVIRFLRDTVRLQVAHNDGAFLSLGASASKRSRDVVLRVGIAALLICLALYAVLRSQAHVLSTFALALVIAGGTSNLIDRYVNDGYVVDFLNIGRGPLRTGIFNIADVALVGGLAIWIVQGWRRADKRDRLKVRHLPTNDA